MKDNSEFDPYASWLGIPPQEQPPDHYRLLGVEPFEQDLTVIKTHAEQRVRQIKMYRRSAHGALCDKLLHQITAAKACLSNPMLKASYDRKLQSELGQVKTPSAMVTTKRPKTEPATVEASPLVDELPDRDLHELSLDSLLGLAPASAPKAPSSSPPSAEEETSDLDLVLDDTDLTSLFGAIEDPLDQKPSSESPMSRQMPRANGKAPEDRNNRLADIAETAELLNQIAPTPEVAPSTKSQSRVALQPQATKRKATAGRMASQPKVVQNGASQGLNLPSDPGYEVLAPRASPSSSSAVDEDEDEPADDDRIPEPHAGRRRSLILGGAIVCVLLVGSVLAWNVWGARSSSFQQPISRAELDRLATKSRPHVAPQTAEPSEAPQSIPVIPGQSESSNVTSPEGERASAANKPRPTPAVAKPDQPIEIGIAYGTEKRKWLQWAVERFATTDEGWHVRVNLIPMGSLESAHAILDGDQRIHVWSPASSLYHDTFVRDWQAKHQGNPILKEEVLALTPMAIVMWKSRYDAYTAKCPEVSLRTFSYAMALETGWDRIAKKPAWGLFKFGHTHPNQSNSGLMTLVAMAYDFHKKTSGLTVSDIMSPEFQEYLARFERGVSRLSNSTGNLMKEMVLKGPPSADALMVYESVVIDYLENAEGRWERLQVVYPQANLWNENPYYILNTPWTTSEHQKAAETLLKFLMSSWVQGQALQHGFRPGNPAVPVKGPESPFVRYARNGLKVELPTVCETPSPDVIENLLQSWIRNAPSR